MGGTSAAHSIFENREELCALIVGPPALDQLLDGLAFRQFFV